MLLLEDDDGGNEDIENGHKHDSHQELPLLLNHSNKDLQRTDVIDYLCEAEYLEQTR